MCEEKDKKYRSCKLVLTLGILIMLVAMLTSVASAVTYTYPNEPFYTITLTTPDTAMANNPFTITLNYQHISSYETDASTALLVINGYDENGNYVDIYTKDQQQVIAGTATFVVPWLSAGSYWCSGHFYDSSGKNIAGYTFGSPSTNFVNLVVYDSPPNSIPEFPSVALPVAAILGLVTILGRRKNMV